MTEDEMVGWIHQLDGHEFEQALGVGDGQGGLVSCGPRDRKESATTERLNNNSYRRGRMSFQAPWGNGGRVWEAF